MGFVVKNTTKSGLLDWLCPHSCRGCGQLGEVLCERCKKYMIDFHVNRCPVCKEKVEKMQKADKASAGLENKTQEAALNERGLSNGDVRQAVNQTDKIQSDAEQKRGIILNDESGEAVSGLRQEDWKCQDCKTGFDGLWTFGWRDGALERLVEEYKYQSVWAMKETLAELYDAMLPLELKSDVVVVPMPTIGRHVRERGLDHTWQVAKTLAKRRGWRCEKLIRREVDTVQVGAKVADRQAQARKAYSMGGELDDKKKYLLVDDVWTTGATMTAAVKLMRAAGAKQVYGAVLAVSKPPKSRTE